jgi:chemotaxis protein CheD
MAVIIDVQTGQVKCAQAPALLQCNALGSCISLLALCPGLKIGGIAHIMLPGAAPATGNTIETRYCHNAVDLLLAQLHDLGVSLVDLLFFAAGAGNVLKKIDDTICQSNIDSLSHELQSRNINLTSQSLGGTQRRRVSMDLDKCQIFLTVGDGAQSQLWPVN